MCNIKKARLFLIQKNVFDHSGKNENCLDMNLQLQKYLIFVTKTKHSKYQVSIQKNI